MYEAIVNNNNQQTTERMLEGCHYNFISSKKPLYFTDMVEHSHNESPSTPESALLKHLELS